MKKALKELFAVWWGMFLPIAIAYLITASLIALLLYISQ